MFEQLPTGFRVCDLLNARDALRNLQMDHSQIDRELRNYHVSRWVELLDADKRPEIISMEDERIKCVIVRSLKDKAMGTLIWALPLLFDDSITHWRIGANGHWPPEFFIVCPCCLFIGCGEPLLYPGDLSRAEFCEAVEQACRGHSVTRLITENTEWKTSTGNSLDGVEALAYRDVDNATHIPEGFISVASLLR